MLHIFICEDDSAQREQIKSIVQNHIMMENLDIRLTFTTDSPTALLKYLEKHPHDPASNEYSLYFLDVDLASELNGIQLAAKIKELEPISYIVFITDHAEMSHLTFRYKVEAMDYITKDFPEEIASRVKDCINTAYMRYLGIHTKSKAGSFQISIGGSVRVIPCSDIMFFESHPVNTHRLILHMKKSQLEFRSALDKIAETLPDFYRCHQSYLVNPENIRHVDADRRVAEMINGESAPIATRKLKGLSTLLKAKS